MNVYKRSITALSIGAAFSIFLGSSSFAQSTTCPLQTLLPYKTPQNPAVYYISEDCKKRPIKNPEVYFSHFASWKDVRVTTQTTLNQIPDHELTFLPWGLRKSFMNGSLVKTVTDPNVYLVANNTELYRIASEEVLTETLGYQFNQIEDVDERVLNKFMVKSDITSDQKGIPLGFVFKYPDDPTVYVTEVAYKEGKLTTGLRHLYTLAEITNKNFRTDRIATVTRTANFEKLAMFNRGVASETVFTNTCRDAFTHTPQAYLEGWKNIFKKENGLSDQQFNSHVSVESVSLREDSEDTCILSIVYNITYSWLKFPQMDVFYLKAEDVVVPNELPLQKNDPYFTGVSSVSLTQPQVFSNEKQVIDFYLKKYNLGNAAVQVQSINVKSAADDRNINNFPGQKGEIFFDVLGIINSKENKCFKGYISFFSKETTYEEVRCER